MTTVESGAVLETIKLEDGTAEFMGDGMFVVTQGDERGRPQRIAVSVQDITALLKAAA